jgi:hypothetical protein
MVSAALSVSLSAEHPNVSTKQLMQTLLRVLKPDRLEITLITRPKAPGGAALQRAEGLTHLGATSPQTTTLTCETKERMRLG